MDNGKDYPNLDFPGGVEGVSKLEHVKSGDAPHINWGEKYESWTAAKKVKYLEKFADSMNHAADLLQQERDELSKVLHRKEEQLKSFSDRYAAQGQLMNDELQKANGREQELNTIIVELQKKIKQQRISIENLRGGREEAA